MVSSIDDVAALDNVAVGLAEPFLRSPPTGQGVWESFVRDDHSRFQRTLQREGSSIGDFMTQVAAVMDDYSFLGQPARRNREFEVLGAAYAALQSRFGRDPEHSFYRVASRELGIRYHQLLVQWRGLTTPSSSPREDKPEPYKAIGSRGH